MNNLSHVNDEFVAKCIESGELQLNDSDRSSHLLPVKYLIIISVVFFLGGILDILINGFNLDINSGGIGLILGSFFFLLVSYFIYQMQKKVLHFFSFETDLSLLEKRQIVNKVGENQNWEKVFDRDNIVIGKIPNIFYWGEKVTIIFSQNTVMINSISDPNKKPNLFAPNHKHINSFVDEFEKVMNK